MQGKVRRLVAAYKKYLAGLNNSIHEKSTDAIVDRMRSIPSRLDQKLEQLGGKYQARLRQEEKSLDQAKQELREFKTKHGIKREADYPESRAWQTYILVGTCLLEAAMNGFFFRQGLQGGVLAGAILAFLIALVDIGIVFFLGRGAVWVAYGTQWIHRIIGALASIIFAVWVSSYNLLTAHVRESLREDLTMTEALQVALSNFLNNPTAIEQADSVFLIASGVLFSLLAFYSGMEWEEKIPRYGKLSRRVDERRDEVEYWRRKLINEAIEEKEEADEKLQDLMEDAEDEYRLLEYYVERKDVLLNNVEQCIRHYRDATVALIREYRDLNMRARSAEPPDYFDEAVEVELIQPPEYDLEKDKRRLEEKQAAIESIRQEIGQIQKQIQTNYQRRLGMPPFDFEGMASSRSAEKSELNSSGVSLHS